MLRDSADSFDVAVKSKLLVYQGNYSTATKLKSTDHARQSLPHLVRKNNLLGQQERTQLPILAMDLKI